MNKKKFETKAISLKKLEQRKEYLVLWRRGEGFFPKDNQTPLLERMD